MALDKSDVAHVARLARLRLGAEAEARLVGELNNILGWIEQLQEVDTEDVPPMTSVVEATPSMREDRITDGGSADDVLANAPEAADGFFVVPKVLE